MIVAYSVDCVVKGAKIIFKKRKNSVSITDQSSLILFGICPTVFLGSLFIND